MPDHRDRETLPYRDCVGVALFNAKGQVFLGHRASQGDPEKSKSSGYAWQMPQGGIDKGEDPLKAALRELYEETNVTSVSLLAEAPEWIYYDFPEEIMGVGFKGKYRGQRQRWFAFAFTGDEGEINVLSPAKGKHKPEFNAWRWDELQSAPQLIVPFKRDAYGKVVDAFADIPRWYFS